ncbi:transcriptional regulator Kaiso isoform X2 [Lepisosteus oculatus]|uniref:transcriptional regulator Kaiso isoform X2 n=1 Tax=Lepisosteus oculatus TaxID=7918 RepID=UPI00371B2BAF
MFDFPRYFAVIHNETVPSKKGNNVTADWIQIVTTTSSGLRFRNLAFATPVGRKINQQDFYFDSKKEGRAVLSAGIVGIGREKGGNAWFLQVKGLPGLSKDAAAGGEESSSDPKDLENGTGNPPSDLIIQDSCTAAMPIITEAFSLSAEEFKQTDGYVDEDSDNDDVIFCSELVPPRTGASGSTAQSAGPPTEIIDLEGPSEKEGDASGGEDSKEVSTAGSSEKQAEDGDKPEPNEKPPAKAPEGDKPAPGPSPAPAQPEPSPRPCPPQREPPDASSNPPPSPAGSSSWDSFCSPPSTPHFATASPLEAYHGPPPKDAYHGPPPKDAYHGPPPKDNQEGTGVQKKQVTTVLEASPAKPGEFKIKLSDVRSAIGAKNGAGQSSPQNLVAGKKTITLDKASEIDSLSTGCKVYANIGENTYDIVIPMKDDPGEGDSKASGGRKARMSSPYSQDSPSRKKVKVRHDDHYELIMDGRTFYVCIVCKRSYVCLTSLRRHFNTHSWEKKYPCRYCDKVFALAEYRTKHEIYHTGERRYQCLLCNEFFINYQLLSSHCKSAHNQDPSGRKEKDDTDNNLYRLLPCKSLQLKPYSYVPNSSGGIPIINEEGLVYHVDPSKTPQSSPGTQPPSTGKQVVNWDDIFVQPGAQPETYINPTEGTSEFEFVIPETY